MKNNKFSTEVIEIPFNDVEFDDVLIKVSFCNTFYSRDSFFDNLSFNGLCRLDKFSAYKILYYIRDCFIPKNSKRRKIYRAFISFRPTSELSVKKEGKNVDLYELAQLSANMPGYGYFRLGTYDISISGNFVLILVFCKKKKDEAPEKEGNPCAEFRPYSELEDLNFRDKKKLLKAVELWIA